MNIKEIITASVADLKEEQVEKLVEAAERYKDENVANFARESHLRYDKDIEAVTGKVKPTHMKTYDFLKEVLRDYHGKVQELDPLKGEYETMKTQLDELNEKLKSGSGDEAIKKKINDLESQVGQWESKYAQDIEQKEKALSEEIRRNTDLYASQQFKEGLAGKKFNAAYDEDTLNTVFDAKVSQARAMYKSDWIDDRGTKTLAWRDSNGDILRNADLKPMTLFEIVDKDNDLSKYFDLGKKAEGTGAEKPKGDTGAAFVLNGAKTQVEVMTKIKSKLAAEGLSVMNPKYQETVDKLWEESGAQKLPIR